MKEILQTDNSPAAIGPYSQGVKCKKENFIFTSGQIPLDPQSMAVVSSNIKEQTIQVIKNLEAVLRQGNSSLENVVKTTIYLTDMNDFATVNKIYEEFFYKSLPARSTVEVSRLPKNVKIEIDAISLVS